MRRSLFLSAAVVAMWPAAANAQLSKTQALIVPDYAALEAVPFALVPNFHSVLVTEAGRGGAFVKTTANLAAIAAIDTGKCVVIPAPGTDGSSGGYVRPDWRSGKKSIDVTWCAAASGFNPVTAQNRAVAVLKAVGGGEFVFPAGTYTYTTSPAVIDASNIRMRCDAGSEIVLDSTGAAVDIIPQHWQGAAAEASRTLAADIVAGDNKITLTSASSPTQIVEGDVIYIRAPHALGGGDTYVTAVKVNRVVGNTVYLAQRIGFAVSAASTVQPGATSSVQRAAGWISNVGWSGECRYRGLDLQNADVTAGSPPTFAALRMENVRDATGDRTVMKDVGNDVRIGSSYVAGLWIDKFYNVEVDSFIADRGGSLGYGDLQISNGGELRVNNVASLNPLGFGPEFFNGSNYQVGNLRSTGAYYRAGKAQSVVNFSANDLLISSPVFTGFAFTNGTYNATVGTAIYDSVTTAPPVAISAMSRASNVVTVTTSTPHGLLLPDHAFTIAGATTTSFNGSFALATVVSATSFTFSQTGSNETATVGSATMARGGSPSVWLYGANKVHFGTLRFIGPSNAGGDIQFSGASSMTVGDLLYDVSPTYSGGVVVGSNLLVGRFNGVAAQSAIFSVHKNGTNQTGLANGVDTQVTFSNAEYNTGSYYNAATGRWTPPAGSVFIGCSAYVTAVTDGGLQQIDVFRNGTRVNGLSTIAFPGTTSAGLYTAGITQSDGDDYFTCNIYSVNGGSAVINGNAGITRFFGYTIQ